jgi:ribose transport system ATP-binding protein
MTDLINAVGITKSFPGVWALRNVSFDLRAGEVHALMGENGAGKSTLMKILAGIYQPDSGEVLVEGKPVHLATPRQAQVAGIGIIHQELNLMNDLTVAQNMFIGREPRNRFGILDERRLNEKARAIFAKMNVAIDPEQNLGRLTVAKQQIVEIAKAVSYDSRVLIMDEPTAALNSQEINDLFSLIDDMRSRGIGVVYISHRMDEIKRIADRVTVLRDGQYVATVQAMTTPIGAIISMMVGRELSQDGKPSPRTEETEIVLEVKQLNCGTAVRDVSFSVKRGEILGFAGLMGAGRTEVARAIFGADRPHSGEVYVHGKLVKIRMPRDAVRARVGYLSEDRKRFGLLVNMNIRANIAMASMDLFTHSRGVLNEGEMRKAAGTYVRQLAIKTPSDTQEVRLLSGGNQQKIVIAKWLLRDCDILIFDEPTRGVDVGAKAEIYKLLNELAAQDKAIILISSELPEILRLSHRIAVMCEGRLTGFLPAGATEEDIMHLATLRSGSDGDAHNLDERTLQ